MLFNIPNSLTWARIALIPIFVGVYYLPDSWLSVGERNFIAAVIFIVAAVTDWFDGYLARTLKQTSAFGAFLDPVADKLMVAAALIMLVQLARIDAILAVIIIGREITISALREWMAKLGEASSVAVAFVGAPKTDDAEAELEGIVIMYDLLMIMIDDDDEIPEVFIVGIIDELRRFFDEALGVASVEG